MVEIFSQHRAEVWITVANFFLVDQLTNSLLFVRWLNWGEIWHCRGWHCNRSYLTQTWNWNVSRTNGPTVFHNDRNSCALQDTLKEAYLTKRWYMVSSCLVRLVCSLLSWAVGGRRRPLWRLLVGLKAPTVRWGWQYDVDNMMLTIWCWQYDVDNMMLTVKVGWLWKWEMYI